MVGQVHETPTVYCATSGLYPPDADLESVPGARVAALPLGVECTFQREGGGAPILVEPSWDATFNVGWSIALIVLGTIILLVGLRRRRLPATNT